MMAIEKFLLVDVAVLFLGLACLWSMNKMEVLPSYLGKLNDKKILDQTSTSLPRLEELLKFELASKKAGSGIQFDALIGLWKFVYVWKQGTDKEDLLSSSLLRLFSASLELKKNQASEQLSRFEISNSIQFGPLLLSFIGSGELKGLQPLLPFFFERIELKFGRSVLISRSLVVPDEINRPFFALIAMEEDGRWLAARGRGGGLAIWLRD